MKLVTTRMMRLVKRMGPRKLKSFPFFAAQKVYAVRDPTTDTVNIKASSTILPDKHIDEKREIITRIWLLTFQ